MVIKRLLIKLSLEQSKSPHPRFAYEFYLKSRHLFNFIERTCLSKLKQRADYDTICIDARYGFDAPYMERSLFILASLRSSCPLTLRATGA